MVADLNDPAAPQHIYDVTEGVGLTVDILINNAGLGQYGAFYSSLPEQEFSMVRVNCAALVRGQRTILPKLSGRFTAFLVRFLPIGLITQYVEKHARPKP